MLSECMIPESETEKVLVLYGSTENHLKFVLTKTIRQRLTFGLVEQDGALVSVTLEQ